MALNFGLDFGSAIGGLVGAIASNASSRKQYKYQSRLQEQAAQLNYNYGIKSLKNSPSAQREGLETAGYNPMLAVQNGVSGANAGWTNAGQASNFDMSSGISSGLNNVLSVQNMKNQTKQTESQIELNQAQSRSAVANAIAQELKNPYITRQEEAQLGRVGAETDKLMRETQYFDALEENLEQMRRLQEMGINLDYSAKIYGANQSYNASTYSADKALEGILKTTNQSGTNSNKSLVGDIAKTLVGAGLAVFVGNKIKLIKPVGDLIKVIPKNILIK